MPAKLRLRQHIFSFEMAVCLRLLVGVVIGACTTAHAQIYNSSLTTSAANPDIYFSAYTGVSSDTSFAGATDMLSYNPGGDAGVVGLNFNYVGINYDFFTQGPITGGPLFTCLFTEGESIGGGFVTRRAFARDLDTYFDTSAGWTYPGDGYIGLDQQVNVNGVNQDYPGLGESPSLCGRYGDPRQRRRRAVRQH